MIQKVGAAFLGTLLTLAAMVLPARAQQLVTQQEVRDATQKGLDFVLGHSSAFVQQNNCFSCHVTAQAVRAGLALEGISGINLDLTKLNAVIDVLYNQQFDADANGDGQPDNPTDADGDGVADILTRDGAITYGGSHTSFGSWPWTTSAWAGMGLSNALTNTASTFDAARFLRLAEYLLRTQNLDGSFPNDHDSPPVNVGVMATTAQAIYAWKKAHEMTPGDVRYQAAIDQAAAFLNGRAPNNSANRFLLDAAWKVLGLIQAGRPANDAQVLAMLDLIKTHQSPDNGWSVGTTQGNPGSTGDAFATGACSCAILAGEGARAQKFQEGLRWLIDNQEEDGGWPQVSSSRVTASTWATICLSTFLGQQLQVTKSFTSLEVVSVRGRQVIQTNPLPKSSQGLDMVEVVIDSRGIASSTRPSWVLGWAETKNPPAGRGRPLNSISLLDTLPEDWAATPSLGPWKTPTPRHGIRVFYKNAAGVQAEINPAFLNIIYVPPLLGPTPGSGTPGTVQVDIANMTAAIGGPLGLNESIVVSISLAYALKGTRQSPSGYPLSAINHMEATGFPEANMNGVENMGEGEASFVQEVKATNRRIIFGTRK